MLVFGWILAIPGDLVDLTSCPCGDWIYDTWFVLVGEFSVWMDCYFGSSWIGASIVSQPLVSQLFNRLFDLSFFLFCFYQFSFLYFFYWSRLDFFLFNVINELLFNSIFSKKKLFYYSIMLSLRNLQIIFFYV
jgi:hypothetical protein